MTEQEVNLLIVKGLINSNIRRRLLNPQSRAALLNLFDLDENEVDLLMGIEAENFSEFAQACVERGLVEDPAKFNPQGIPPTVSEPSPRQK